MTILELKENTEYTVFFKKYSSIFKVIDGELYLKNGNSTTNPYLKSLASYNEVINYDFISMSIEEIINDNQS